MKKLLILLMAITMFACNSGDKKEQVKTTKATEVAETTIDIGGLHCNNCVASVEKGINALDGIEEVTVTLADSTAVVKFNASAVNIDEIKKSIENRGYKIKSVK